MPLIARGNAVYRDISASDPEEVAFQERKRRAKKLGQNVDWDKDPKYRRPRAFFAQAATAHRPDESFEAKLSRAVKDRLSAQRQSKTQKQKKPSRYRWVRRKHSKSD